MRFYTHIPAFFMPFLLQTMPSMYGAQNETYIEDEKTKRNEVV